MLTNDFDIGLSVEIIFRSRLPVLLNSKIIVINPGPHCSIPVIHFIWALLLALNTIFTSSLCYVTRIKHNPG
jgi:hypothetical protein